MGASRFWSDDAEKVFTLLFFQRTFGAPSGVGTGRDCCWVPLLGTVRGSTVRLGKIRVGSIRVGTIRMGTMLLICLQTLFVRQ